MGYVWSPPLINNATCLPLHPSAHEMMVQGYVFILNIRYRSLFTIVYCLHEFEAAKAHNVHLSPTIAKPKNLMNSPTQKIF